MVRAEDLGLALGEFDSLYLKHQLGDAITTAYVALSVAHSIHIRRKDFKQYQRIGI